MSVIRKKTSAVAIIIVVLCIITFFVYGVFMLIEPNDFIVDMLPYEIVKQYLLYDHITYNGVDYYLAKPGIIPPDVDNGHFITEDVYIVLVDKDSVPYEENRKETAWLYENDPEAMYIYFNSADYTRSKSLASECYGFAE